MEINILMEKLQHCAKDLRASFSWTGDHFIPMTFQKDFHDMNLVLCHLN